MEKKLILKKTGSIRQQILDYYREGIQSGQIPIGTVLPSARSIALEHQIAEANVHCALARLAQEGWIERLPKRGSLVIKRRQMHTVAFFMSGLYTRRGERFTQPLLQKIESTLKGHGIERCQVLYDSGSGEGFELLKSYAQNKQIQGVIARGFVPELEDAFAKLPIPYVQMGGASPFHSVGFFSEKVAELMAEALARQGLRRAGILWPSLDKNFIPALVRAAAARQIEIREDWIFSGAKFGRDIVDIDEFAWLGTHYLLNQL